jgi:hypothetical protein
MLTLFNELVIEATFGSGQSLRSRREFWFLREQQIDHQRYEKEAKGPWTE